MSLNYDTETSGLPNKESAPHFTHLHVHSHYSMLDGMSKVPDLVAKCKKNGMYSLALTDHGNMFGIKDFADTVNKENGKVKDAIKEVKAEKTKLESNESGEMSEEEKAAKIDDLNSQLSTLNCLNRYSALRLIALPSASTSATVVRTAAGT